MTNPMRRVDELDILRGMSVIGMLMVILPGTWEYRFQWLNHAQWSGYPLVDMIFPSFLFCVGFAIPISLSKRSQGLKNNSATLNHLFIRCFLLVAIGVLTNGFPYFDWSNIRIPGVLQRIGLCWFIVSVIFIMVRNQSVFHQAMFLGGVLFTILIGYWSLLTFVSVPGFGNHRFDSLGSWPAYIDRVVFGINHLWPYGTTDGAVTFDPEGLLSTLPACINVLVGSILALLYINRSPFFNHRNLILGGLILMILGWFIGVFELMPIIKKIWTSSFALLSTGFSVLLLGLIGLSLKFKKVSLNYAVAKVFGTNALLAFVASAIIGALIDLPISDGMSLRNLGFNLLNSWITDPAWASFTFTMIVLGMFYWALLKLHQQKIYWRV